MCCVPASADIALRQGFGFRPRMVTSKRSRLLVAKCTSTMVPFGVVEASQPLATRPETGPPHGIAKRPERYRLHPYARHLPSHRPWYRRSVPTVQQPHQSVAANRPPSTPTQTDGIAVASRPSATKPEPARENHAHPPHGIAEASRAKPSQPTCACLQPHPQTMVSPERPEVDRSHLSPTLECAAPRRSSQWDHQQHLGPSWSVRHLAAPHSVGPAVSVRSNSAHQCVAPATSIDSATKPFTEACGVTKAAKLFSAFARSAFSASQQRREYRQSVFAFSSALLNCASWSSRDCLSTADE